jgi:hypothetical protein
VLDGVYRNSTAVFHEVAAPTPEELQALLAKIITRIMRWLTKQGFLIEEQDRTYLAEADRESALLPRLPTRADGAARSEFERAA